MDRKDNGSQPPREVLPGFFVLEGIDGSGTTTQLRRLEARAQAERVSFRADFEPTDHPIGRLIRSILRREISADPRVLAPLFAADRRQHVDGPGGIREAVGNGTVVVSDRYWFSSLAYQSLDLPWDEVWNWNSMFPLPEAVFWFELPVETAQTRIASRGQPLETFEDLSSQRRVLDAYHGALDQARDEGLVVHRIDATEPIESITDSIWRRICR